MLSLRIDCEFSGVKKLTWDRFVC